MPPRGARAPHPTPARPRSAPRAPARTEVSSLLSPANRRFAPPRSGAARHLLHRGLVKTALCLALTALTSIAGCSQTTAPEEGGSTESASRAGARGITDGAFDLVLDPAVRKPLPGSCTVVRRLVLAGGEASLTSFVVTEGCPIDADPQRYALRLQTEGCVKEYAAKADGRSITIQDKRPGPSCPEQHGAEVIVVESKPGQRTESWYSTDAELLDMSPASAPVPPPPSGVTAPPPPLDSCTGAPPSCSDGEEEVHAESACVQDGVCYSMTWCGLTFWCTGG